MTDPPFNVGINYGEGINDNLDDVEYSKWCYKWINELYRLLKPNHYAIIFTGDKKLYYIFDAIMKTKFIFHHFLKWHKPLSRRALSGTVFWYRTELAFILSKEKPNTKLINRKILYQDTLTYNNTIPPRKKRFRHVNWGDQRTIDHPAKRPLELYKHIIKGFTNENDNVLDIFMGSGTSIAACILTNRNFNGFDIDKDSYNICNSIIKFYERRLDRK